MYFILYLIIIFLLKLLFRYLQTVVYAATLYIAKKKKRPSNNIYTESLVNNQVYLGTVYVQEKLRCF